MHPTTNTGHKSVKTQVWAVIGVIAMICFIWKRLAIFEMLTHTRSSGDVENLAPFQAFLFTAVISGWVGIIIMTVVVRMRVPNDPSRDPFWVKQDRRDMCGNLVGYVMIFTIVCTWTIAILVHLFA